MNVIEQLLLVQFIVVSFFVAVMAYRLTSGEGAQRHKWAKVRIPVNQNQKHHRQRAKIQEEEEYEAWPAQQFLVVGIVTLLVMLAILGVYAG